MLIKILILIILVILTLYQGALDLSTYTFFKRSMYKTQQWVEDQFRVLTLEKSK